MNVITGQRLNLKFVNESAKILINDPIARQWYMHARAGERYIQGGRFTKLYRSARAFFGRVKTTRMDETGHVVDKKSENVVYTMTQNANGRPLTMQKIVKNEYGDVFTQKIANGVETQTTVSQNGTVVVRKNPETGKILSEEKK